MSLELQIIRNEIYALDGRHIALASHAFHFHGGERQAIDLSGLASGRYFLRFHELLHGYSEVISFQKL